MEIIKKNECTYSYPTKPKRDSFRDSKYNKIKLFCNLKLINISKAIHIYQYNISDNIKDNFHLKRDIFINLREKLKELFENYVVIDNYIYSISQNTKDNIILNTSVNDILFQIKIMKLSSVISCSDIINKTSQNIKVKNFLEVVISKIYNTNKNLSRLGKSLFFDFRDSFDAGKYKIRLNDSYFNKINITEKGLCLLINQYKTIINNISVYDRLQEFHKKYVMITNDNRSEINKYFKGKKIITKYNSYKCYRIGEICYDKNINNTVIEIYNNGFKKTMTLKEYYKYYYNIIIKHEEQPIIIEDYPKNNKTNKQYYLRFLIPELCYIIGIDEISKKLKKDINDKIHPHPNIKMEKIEKGFSFLNDIDIKHYKLHLNQTYLSPNQVRNKWGINIAQNFLEVQAFHLQKPKINFGHYSSEYQLINGRFKLKKVYNSIDFNHKTMMLIAFEDMHNIAKDYLNKIKKEAKNIGVIFNISEIKFIKKYLDDKILLELKEINYDPKLKIILFILDHKSKNLYPIIKNFLYTVKGITSQCILHDINSDGTVKQRTSIYYNCLLNQIIAKVNDELFKIEFPEILSKYNTMIIGIKYSYNKEGKKYILSASYNSNLNKYFTIYNIEKNNENILELLIKSCLDSYMNYNMHNLPNIIIIYFKSSNNKKIQYIINFEITKIINSFKSYKNDYNPNITIFNVNTKDDLIIYNKNNEQYIDILPGTIIDQGIIPKDIFEFYLKGRKIERINDKPVLFSCLFNNNKILFINDFEEISYYLSYYYPNWTGPMNIPTVLKYVELADAFTSKYIKGEISKELYDSPYFI